MNKQWTYGVTTVPSRRETTLPRTLESLAAAGFDSPRIREDDTVNDRIYAPGNWWLLMWELWIRSEGGANFYAIFQDDVIAVKGLREHIERSELPEKVYLNLYVDFRNAPLADGKKGWFYSNQMGRGALGLVFDKECVRTLLCTRYMVDRFVPDPRNGPERHREALDGGIVCALKKEGYREMCHNPSLVDHIGMQSTISSTVWPAGSPLWKGETSLDVVLSR
jgi:hypothetical protein